MEQTNNVRQEWQPNADESLYGLGQHQQGLFDIKDYDLDFHQYNTEVFIPFLASSRGYGILWDNASFTRFGDLAEPAAIPGVTYQADGNLTGASTGSINLQATIQAPTTGDYVFYAHSSGTIQVDVDGKRVIDHYRQGWLPSGDIARVRLQAGQSYPLRVQWTSDINVNTVSLRWKPPVATRTTSLWSEVGDGIDYYFVYGPQLDSVIAGYRTLTGKATMPPIWSFGFWQSRDRYTSAQESLDVLAGYRMRQIPIDNIVQDWQYWPANGWGSHAFEASRFPDPAAWIKEIHDTYHARLMISVWPKFYSGTANFTALNQAGFLYQPNLTENLRDFLDYPYTYYDAFSADARKLYWSQLQTALFSKGVDAWWADASEPDINEDVGPKITAASHLETLRNHMTPTALGTGSRVLNAYALHHNRGIYEGQRAAAANQRVFILTRNAFAGQQRFGSVTWSGDVTSTWSGMQKQLSAGLSFALSGMPYWTMDVGGYSVPTRFANGGAEWQELNARWFEFGTFLPVLRVHGQAPKREMWEFGGNTSATYLAEVKFDRLRYRLLPYIYSLAGAVTQSDATIMRPLVMDFRDDPAVRGVFDQFMFGPALLVCPVTTYQARTRSVVLPNAAGWYDFWTGVRSAGGQTLAEAPAPLDQIPLYSRQGSILPFGPELQYTQEKPADPITLYVYTGADASFTLYEDDGLSYDYEQGTFATIPITWHEATSTLSLGARQGSFASMLASRTFQIVRVTPTKPVGFSFTPTPDKTVTYTGAAQDVSF
jgi:alpha-D-xyloside xylohydrolase